MKCYIYFIINQIDNKRYVGQTTNFSRRKNQHIRKLKDNIHPNPKLQNAWNTYGEENFIIEKITYENLSKQELDEMEIYYIKKYNTFGENGYNLTEGGTGGAIRNKLNFEQFCFAYFGNIKYKGMTNRTGKYLNVDSACIASIARQESYDSYRERAELLSDEEKKKFLIAFEKEMDIENNKPWIKQQTQDKDNTLKIMCVASTYGRGIESVILKHFSLSKGFIFHLMTGKGRQEIKDEYAKMTQEEVQQIGEKYFQEWNLQQYSKIKIKKQYTNLLEKYH